MGQVVLFGARTYAMRIWLDADKLANMSLTAMDVVNAVSEQNIQTAAGAIGQPPARRGQQFQYSVTTQGRLTDAAEFGNIIVRTRADGSIVYVKDVARVELGSQDYGSFVRLNGGPTAFVAVYTLPGGNSLERRTPGQSPDGAPGQAFSGRDGVHHRLRYHQLRAGIDHRGLADVDRGHLAGAPRRVHFPSELACHIDSRSHHPRVPDRHLRSNEGAGILDQFVDAFWPGVSYRSRGG